MRLRATQPAEQKIDLEGFYSYISANVPAGFTRCRNKRSVVSAYGYAIAVKLILLDVEAQLALRQKFVEPLRELTQRLAVYREFQSCGRGILSDR